VRSTTRRCPRLPRATPSRRRAATASARTPRRATAPRAPTSASSVPAAIADRFPFVQLELAGTIGLGDGRYLAHEPAPERVIVIRTRDAPRAPARLRRRRPKPSEPSGELPAVPLTTVTVITPQGADDPGGAPGWLAKLRADHEAAEREVDDAVAAANRALHAHRTAALDPYLADISADHALTVRIGHGRGEQLADGRWDEAIELPPSARRRRSELLQPQERVADVLAGRERVAACEALVLRARADLDQGRLAEAALQLRAGLEALLADVRDRQDARKAEELADLEARVPPTEDAAEEALRRSLSPARSGELAETLRLCERTLKRRRV
jgi:hypothetical protein